MRNRHLSALTLAAAASALTRSGEGLGASTGSALPDMSRVFKEWEKQDQPRDTYEIRCDSGVYDRWEGLPASAASRHGLKSVYGRFPNASNKKKAGKRRAKNKAARKSRQRNRRK